MYLTELEKGSKIINMEKIRYSEMFYSVQGEGRFVGVPSVFFRTFGCNFECRGFGQPRGDFIPIEQMPHNTDPKADPDHPEAYKTFEELPVTNIGCDTSASWSAKYKHLAAWDTVDVIAKKLTAMTPEGKWTCSNGQDVHLVITGGEPLMWQKQITALLTQPEFADIKNVTFETNTTHKLKPEFVQMMLDLSFGPTRNPENFVKFTWSCSPKLTCSGEKWEEAILPEVAAEYYGLPGRNFYFKFVVSDDQDVEEVDKAVALYKEKQIECDVYLMPCGATQEGQAKTAQQVAELCLKKGYKFSPRLHVDLFGNAWGT
jgi:organic radical activating enzyme